MITDDDLNQKIENALDELRPYLEADGGGIALIDVTDDMVVKLKYLGACSSCSMSTSTFKAGVEQVILKAVPNISKVEVINMPSS